MRPVASIADRHTALTGFRCGRALVSAPCEATSIAARSRRPAVQSYSDPRVRSRRAVRGYSDRGALSSTGTRKVPSMISCVRSATMVLISSGSFASQA
jgi:hypothetical protein